MDFSHTASRRNGTASSDGNGSTATVSSNQDAARRDIATALSLYFGATSSSSSRSAADGSLSDSSSSSSAPLLSAMPTLHVDAADDRFTAVTVHAYPDWMPVGCGQLPGMESASRLDRVGYLRFGQQWNHAIVSAYDGQTATVHLAAGCAPASVDATVLGTDTFLLVLAARTAVEVTLCHVDLQAPGYPITTQRTVPVAVNMWVARAWFHRPTAEELVLVVLTSVGTVVQAPIRCAAAGGEGPELTVGSGGSAPLVLGSGGWRHAVSSFWSLINARVAPMLLFSALGASHGVVAFLDSTGTLHLHALAKQTTAATTPGAITVRPVGEDGGDGPLLPVPAATPALLRQGAPAAVALNMAATPDAPWQTAVSFSDGAHRFYRVAGTAVVVWDQLPPSRALTRVTHAAVGATSIVCYDPSQSLVEITHFTLPFFLHRSDQCRLVTTVHVGRQGLKTVVLPRELPDRDAFVLFGPEEQVALRILSPAEIIATFVETGSVAPGEAHATATALAQHLGATHAASLLMQICTDPRLRLDDAAATATVLAMLSSLCLPEVVESAEAAGSLVQIRFSGAAAAAAEMVKGQLKELGARRLGTLAPSDAGRLWALSASTLAVAHDLARLFDACGWLRLARNAACDLPSNMAPLVMHGALHAQVLLLEGRPSFSTASAAAAAGEPLPSAGRRVASTLQIAFLHELIDGLRQASDVCAVAAACFQHAPAIGLAAAPRRLWEMTLADAAWAADTHPLLTRLFLDRVSQLDRDATAQLAQIEGLATVVARLPPAETVVYNAMLLAAERRYSDCFQQLQANTALLLSVAACDADRTALLRQIDHADPPSLYLLQGTLAAIRALPRGARHPTEVPRLDTLFGILDAMERAASEVWEACEAHWAPAPPTARHPDDDTPPDVRQRFDTATRLLLQSQDSRVLERLALWTRRRGLVTRQDTRLIRHHAETWAALHAMGSRFSMGEHPTSLFVDRTDAVGCYFDAICQAGQQKATLVAAGAPWIPAASVASALLELATAHAEISLDARRFLADEADRLATAKEQPDVAYAAGRIRIILDVHHELLTLLGGHPTTAADGLAEPADAAALAERQALATRWLDAEALKQMAGQCRHGGAQLQLKLLFRLEQHFTAHARGPDDDMAMNDLPEILVAAFKGASGPLSGGSGGDSARQRAMAFVQAYLLFIEVLAQRDFNHDGPLQHIIFQLLRLQVKPNALCRLLLKREGTAAGFTWRDLFPHCMHYLDLYIGGGGGDLPLSPDDVRGLLLLMEELVLAAKAEAAGAPSQADVHEEFLDCLDAMSRKGLMLKTQKIITDSDQEAMGERLEALKGEWGEEGLMMREDSIL